MAVATVDAKRAAIEARAALGPERVLADIALVARRNLRKVQRSPGLIIFSTIQPLMQLILFVFVFGSIANIGPGESYRDFVVPAVLVQAIAFAAMGSGVGIAYDLQSGMIDRFRSLPIARSAFLVGRTLSDSFRLGLQSLLLVAAVAGREIQPELLERVAGLDAEHLLVNLEPAVAAGLVVAGRPIRCWREAGLLAVAGSLGLHATLRAARVLRTGALGVPGVAAPQFLVPRLIVKRLVVAWLAGCGLVVAKLTVVHAREPRIGRT